MLGSAQIFINDINNDGVNIKSSSNVENATTCMLYLIIPNVTTESTISYIREACKKNWIFYDNELISIATYPPYL